MCWARTQAWFKCESTQTWLRTWGMFCYQQEWQKPPKCRVNRKTTRRTSRSFNGEMSYWVPKTVSSSLAMKKHRTQTREITFLSRRSHSRSSLWIQTLSVRFLAKPTTICNRSTSLRMSIQTRRKFWCQRRRQKSINLAKGLNFKA